MALTVRTNGSGSSNIVQANWWNDYHDLLTGAMPDQPVTLKSNFTTKAIAAAPPAGQTVVQSGGSLGVGVYQYAQTYVDATGGETLPSPTASATTTTGNTAVTFQNLLPGPTGTVARKIYRTKVGGSQLYYLATINDNSTSYIYDSAADSTLYIDAPLHSTFGGTISAQDANGNTRFQVSNDGAFLNNIILQANYTQPPPTPTASSPTSGGNLAVGTYKWAVTWQTADGGESLASGQATRTTTSGNQTVSVSLPIGPAGTTARNIYRTQVGGSQLYWLGVINDNTTTTYSDQWPDANLVTSRVPLVHSTFGGSLIVKDPTGATVFRIADDGSIYSDLTVSGTTYLGVTNVYGELTIQSGSNLLISGGKIGKSADGDIIDAGNNDTYIKARGSSNNIFFQVPNGTTVFAVNSGGIDTKGNAITSGNISCTNIAMSNGFNMNGGSFNLFNGATINAANTTWNGTGLLFASGIQLNGALLLQPGNTATPSAIQTGTAGIGIKMNNGTKIFEVNGSGNGLLKGTLTTSATTFDNFDVAECYYVDQVYNFGTVVCSNSDTMAIPADKSAYNPTMTQCTHDACNACTVVSQSPGVILGRQNIPSDPTYDSTLPLSQPMAMSGRIYAKTAYDIPARVYVCSDGRGGVRQVQTGEKAFAIGVTLGPSSQGLAPITLRNTFVSL